MRTTSQTDPGRQRETNEDAVLCESLGDDSYLLAVADGMGGHRAGDVASRTAVIELREAVTRAFADGQSDTEDVLRRAIEKANEEIQTLTADNPELEGMGTTLVTAVVSDEEGVIANVGDSRAYLIGDAIEQITEDQTLVRELVEQGNLDEEEAEEHPQRHVLSQALGTNENIEPEFVRRVLDQATLLLCSDGLTEEVDDETIAEVIRESTTLEQAGKQLVKRANANGGSDNITVVLSAT